MWRQLLVTLVGIELMVAPAVLDLADAAADSFRTAGPVIAAVGFLSAFAITRVLRWINLAPGVWLLAAPWLIEHSQSATLNSLAAGAVTLLLAVGGRADMNRYGGGWRALFPTSRPNPD